MITSMVNLIFFLCIPAFYISASLPLVVQLTTEAKLLPLYISPIQNEQSGFSEAYLKKLESVLNFDFQNNGMTNVVDPSLKDSSINQTMNFDYQGDLSFWSSLDVEYVLKTKINNKSFSARIWIVNGSVIKAIDGLLLTGDFTHDRQVMHQLSDSIFKALFGKEGIASTKILYTLKHRDLTGKKLTSTIYEADYDGGNAHPVTEGCDFAITPFYIPPRSGYKSNSFLFVSYKTGQPKIYFGSLQDLQAHRFSLLKGNQFFPVMSKQRDKIAFISDVTGNPDLFLQEFHPEKGVLGKPRQIYATHKATQSSPTFSPDGTQVAFVSNQDGSPRIYVLKIPDPNVGIKEIKAKLISKTNRENTAPNWSPDGSKIAYSSQVKGVRQICVYDFATNSERQLTEGNQNKENPTWAPNSLHLIFNTSDKEDTELYLMNIKQKTPIKITNGFFPCWEN